MTTVSNKGIIYCRVSSQEQVSGTSLDSQQRACLEYAENKGIKVEEIFIERGESATAASRTELIKALDYCKAHKNQINAFIVWKIDRFARNTTDHYGLQAQLAKYGTVLHSVTEPMINEGPVGKVLEAVLAGFAQFENDIRKQRCEGGMQRQLAGGIWCWQPPIGYIQSKKVSERRKTRPDEPDPERFHLIQKMLKEYATGKFTMLALTKLVNEWGLKTRTNRPMSNQLIEKILKDKYYAGILINPWTKEECRGQHKPMITREEFMKIQYIKSGRSRLENIPHVASHPDFPLRKFIRCVCNGKLTGSWRRGRGGRYAYYSCNNKGCWHYSHGIPKKILEEKFAELLQTITPTEGFISTFEKVVIELWNGEYAAFKQERQHYDRQLKRLKERQRELEVMRMNREITPERFLELKDEIDNQVVGIQISSNESRIEELDIEAAIAYAKLFMRNLVRQWQELKEVKQKQRFQALVLPEGIIFDKVTNTFGTAVLSPVFTLSENFTGNESDLVAGARIALTPRGYEPREVLLLHPANVLYIKKYKNCNTNSHYYKILDRC